MCSNSIVTSNPVKNRYCVAGFPDTSPNDRKCWNFSSPSNSIMQLFSKGHKKSSFDGSYYFHSLKASKINISKINVFK